MTTMGLEYEKYQESKRSNLARESETNRSNLANEAETKRSNLAREAETNRSNLANEAIRQGTLDETVRTNKANESIKRDTLTETKRSNMINEGIKRDTLNETKRANQVNENIKRDTLSEQERANKAKEAENTRAATATNITNLIKSLPETTEGIMALRQIITENEPFLIPAQKSLMTKLNAQLANPDLSEANKRTIYGQYAGIANSVTSAAGNAVKGVAGLAALGG